ncbi:hypothetical protein M431DRAFT_178135 [Trichoderma harzianum CBS 226.95]|uniref:Uncharacterized protein n=1 Tax=Trichoderma harzianum CBS 226.95 TaxID=983964 RepID=A0A2T4ATQ4_TRIHA|nr:hypothetical protein M431DRAFT_178135 [Trichoderma harzianum CBS 226.95]PTB60358.1 hypothetical protein M431DRAFT_178135 [Trichoderma harzianum CBS 226.95]
MSGIHKSLYYVYPPSQANDRFGWYGTSKKSASMWNGFTLLYYVLFSVSLLFLPSTITSIVSFSFS